MADRKTGIGFDQLIIMDTPATGSDEHIFMRIFNADGSEVEACGNATRCVGRILLDEDLSRSEALIRTCAGLLRVSPAHDGLVSVRFGAPRCEWQDIPLAQPVLSTMSINLLDSQPPALLRALATLGYDATAPAAATADTAAALPSWLEAALATACAVNTATRTWFCSRTHTHDGHSASLGAPSSTTRCPAARQRRFVHAATARRGRCCGAAADAGSAAQV